MELFKKQRQSFRDSTARLNIWTGSVRSGKTYITLLRFIKAVHSASMDGNIYIIGKTFDAMKRNIISPLQALLGNDFRYSSGNREAYMWGRTIHAIGANDERAEGKIRGDTVSLAYGDEITLWPEGFFKMLDSRLSLDSSTFIGTTNPDSPYHWLKTEYLDKEELDLINFHFLLDDNSYLSKKYISEIKKTYTGLWYKRFILGEWCAAEGAIYDFFDEEQNVISGNPEAEYYTVGCDYGVTNPCVFLLFGHNRETHPAVWCEAEYVFNSKIAQYQKTDYDYADDFISFVKKNIGQDFSQKLKCTYIDPSASSFALELKKRGIYVKDADNSVLPGIATKSKMLKDGSFAICDTCPEYIKEMLSYSWDIRSQKLGIDKPLKTGDHCQDAGRYAIHSQYGGNTIDYFLLSRW